MGISYRRFATDGLFAKPRKRGQYKFTMVGGADPVPAGRPDNAIDPNYKYRPGTSARDPVPARIASETHDLPSFKAVSDEDFVGPDPVPAINLRPEE